MMQNSDIVYGSLFMRAQKIVKDAQVLFFTPPMIPGYSASSDIELNMQDKTGGNLDRFFDISKEYMAALTARPEDVYKRQALSSTFETKNKASPPSALISLTKADPFCSFRPRITTYAPSLAKCLAMQLSLIHI